ncbi:META domain-containing protein [Lacinutrix sp. Bg11-31]|uniref:META domain-containing protein n=1 Tax=Lacinutrix sp. Bg11-31 TaxID=2057808 RepID=UPI000C30E721|nr:META domain-containing protein [Lacinutrix sp. Bg11-31]AUC82783.1 hypothetical protein CW733_11885 [Lacinutrix sp. Bg11-31]
MKTTTILLFAIILNACGASNKVATKLSDDNMKNAQESLNGTFTVLGMDMKNLTEDLTISFDEANSKVSGFSGCNSFFGTYTANGNTIKFNGLASTRKMCADENGNMVESKIMAALGEVTNFEIKDKKLVLLNAKKELLSATKSTESKLTQDTIKIEYRAHARGNFKNIILENKTVSVKNKYDGKPIVLSCNDTDWDMLLKMVSDTNLKTLATLEAPSKAHQYDGAAIANLIITKEGETYTTPAFDAGNPNKDIESLVNLVIKIAEVTKEKN